MGGRREKHQCVDEAIGLLNGSQDILIYVGRGALGSSRELIELSEQLDALVFTTSSAKGIFPEDNHRWGWNTMGRAAPEPIRGLIDRADCVLAIGCRFGEVATASYGFRLPEKLIHVDVDPSALNRNYPAKLAIEMDAKEFIQAVISSGKPKKRVPNDGRLKALQSAHQSVRAHLSKKSSVGKVSPGALFEALQRHCGPEALYVTDSGNGTFLAMEHLRLTEPRSFLAPVDYSCMGYCVPAAIGAKLAQPHRTVVALEGDGAFLMTGLELATASFYRAGVLVFVLRDGELSQIAQFQRASLNRVTCTDVHDYQLEQIARAVGAEFLCLKDDSSAIGIVGEALAISQKDKPVVVEVEIDYSIPTYFSKGVVVTNFLRFPWKDRLRLVSRVITRKFLS